MHPASGPKVFRVRTEADLDRISFDDGMVAVDVPADLIDRLELKHTDRGDSPRLQGLMRSIRDRGFQPVEPISVRIGRKGRWVVINGGHRLTAARWVMRGFWANLFGEKVRTFYFILFTDPESWAEIPPPPGVEIERTVQPEDAELR